MLAICKLFHKRKSKPSLHTGLTQNTVATLSEHAAGQFQI